jgi:hypothetical protein
MEIDNCQEQMDSVSREKKSLWKNKKGMFKRSTVPEMKNSFDAYQLTIHGIGKAK